MYVLFYSLRHLRGSADSFLFNKTLSGCGLRPFSASHRACFTHLPVSDACACIAKMFHSYGKTGKTCFLSQVVLACGKQSACFALRARCAMWPHPFTPVLCTGCKWGVWGEGSEAAGSPHSFTAKILLWRRGP